MSETQTVKPAALRFNTFSGVFVPSVLAILGAVMYLIAPKVLGGVGIIKMFGILLVAHSITVATAYSISAITTNIKVKGGGLYYLISRSLGREFGGSMGIQLYLAQTIGTAFYTIAFTKVLYALLLAMGYRWNETYLALICYFIFFIIAFKGAKFVIKIQYMILALIVLSLISIFAAPNVSDSMLHLTGAGGIAIPFWIAFALFFPAVTGIDAGVGMSGDLKNPRKSLVKGTFLAIFFTFIVYSILMIKLTYLASPYDLSSNVLIAKDIARWPSLVYIGILVATISSALSYLMTSPRTLRALVEDKIFSPKMNFLAKSIGNSREPRIALIISFIIGSVVIYFGGLDIVSKIVAMFFLNVYGWINGAAFFESLSRNPSYRPTFNAPLPISFFGMAACYSVMFLFNPFVMIGGILFQLLVFYFLTKNRPSIRYESVWDGVRFQLLRWALRNIEEGEKSKKNWRPTIISFAINQKNHTQMFSLLDWISSNRGFMKMYALVRGDVITKTEDRLELQNRIKSYVKDYSLELFPRVIVTRNYENAIETVIQSETIGNRPLNTILIDYDERANMMKLANISLEQEKNFLILRSQAGVTDFRKIDVWWSSPSNGNLAILLAYLITESSPWKENDPVIRIFTLVDRNKDMAVAKEKVNRLVLQSRIENVEINVLKRSRIKLAEHINKMSCYSDLVIVGLPKNRAGKIDHHCIRRVRELTERLSASLIVSAYEEIDFKVN